MIRERTWISRSSGSCSSIQILTLSSNSCFLLGALLLIFLYSLLSAKTWHGGFETFLQSPPVLRKAWNLRRNIVENADEETLRRFTRAVLGEERKKLGWRRRRVARGISRASAEQRRLWRRIGQTRESIGDNTASEVRRRRFCNSGLRARWAIQN